MHIPLVDVTAQHAALRAEIEAAMAEVVAGGRFVKGPAVAEFEAAFAAFCGVAHAVGVGNGTDALRLALQALGVGPGDDVVTVPTTFVATAEAVGHVGARARFVDVHPDTWLLDPAHLDGGLTPQTRAVVPVHLYGHVSAVPRPRGIAVIEDAAQAHGARHGDRRVGALGDAAAFSFYPGKNLGAYGDAGAVVTADPDVAERVRLLADHGRATRHDHVVEGWNSRLDSLQAAVLSVKLRHLDAANEARRRFAARYRDALADVPHLTFPDVAAGTEPVHHLLVAAAERRDELRAFLEARGVETGVHYPVPLHLQPSHRHLGYARGDFPVAERLAASTVSLPLYPEMGEAAVDEVSAAVRAFYAVP